MSVRILEDGKTWQVVFTAANSIRSSVTQHLGETRAKPNRADKNQAGILSVKPSSRLIRGYETLIFDPFRLG